MAACVALGGCAEPWSRHLAGVEPAAMSLPLDGVYDATLHTEFAGAVTFRLAAKPTEEGFAANTRPGVAWEFVGGLEGVLGRLLVPYLFPGGVLVTWTSEVPQEGHRGEGWLRAGAIPGASVRTRMASAGGPIEIVARDGKKIGVMTLRPSPDPEGRLADYAGLAGSLERALRERWYRPDDVREASLEAFHRRVREVGGQSHDDLEFLFGIAMAARAHLRTIPAVPTRRLDPRFSEEVRLDRRFVTYTPGAEGRPGVLRIDAMLDIEEVEAGFSAVRASSPPGLVLDLRTCAGMDARLLRVIGWFMEGKTPAGFVVDARTREALLAGEAEWADVDPTLEGATLDGGMVTRLVVPGREDRYDGPLVVLVSRRTFGVPEVIAWALQQAGRAAVVGEATVGRALLYEGVEIEPGWEAQMPTREIVRGPGVVSSRVVPDELTTRERALRAAERRLTTGMETGEKKAKSPYEQEP